MAIEKADISSIVRIDTTFFGADENGLFFRVYKDGLTIQMIGKIYLAKRITFVDPRFSLSFDTDKNPRITEEI